FDNGYELEMRNLTEEAKDGLRVMAAVRPEEFIIHKEPTPFAVTVHQSSFLGLNTHYFAHLDDGTNIQVVHESEFNDRTGIGSKLYLTMNAAKINVLSEDGSHTLIAEETSDNA
ncbi:MAG: TOBE domain-containing protein, partial [Erysipelotrichales bacterium]|nr:TOBE domain-containing protein [Erysipelotrichales bacterium]